MYINLGIVRLLEVDEKIKASYSDWCEIYVTVTLICISLIMSDVEHLFMYFLLAILIPDCASSSPAFLMMYSARKLNKHGDNNSHFSILALRTP